MCSTWIALRILFEEQDEVRVAHRQRAGNGGPSVAQIERLAQERLPCRPRHRYLCLGESRRPPCRRSRRSTCPSGVVQIDRAGRPPASRPRTRSRRSVHARTRRRPGIASRCPTSRPVDPSAFRRSNANAVARPGPTRITPSAPIPRPAIAERRGLFGRDRRVTPSRSSTTTKSLPARLVLRERAVPSWAPPGRPDTSSSTSSAPPSGPLRTSGSAGPAGTTPSGVARGCGCAPIVRVHGLLQAQASLADAGPAQRSRWPAWRSASPRTRRLPARRPRPATRSSSIRRTRMRILASSDRSGRSRYRRRARCRPGSGSQASANPLNGRPVTAATSSARTMRRTFAGSIFAAAARVESTQAVVDPRRAHDAAASRSSCRSGPGVRRRGTADGPRAHGSTGPNPPTNSIGRRCSVRLRPSPSTPHAWNRATLNGSEGSRGRADGAARGRAPRGVGLAVPTSMPRYTSIESTLTISALEHPRARRMPHRRLPGGGRTHQRSGVAPKPPQLRRLAGQARARPRRAGDGRAAPVTRASTNVPGVSASSRCTMRFVRVRACVDRPLRSPPSTSTSTVRPTCACDEARHPPPAAPLQPIEALLDDLGLGT